MPRAPKNTDPEKKPKRPGAPKEAAKLAAALKLAEGVGPSEIAESGIIGRTTLWRLIHGETTEAKEFQAFVEDLRERIAREASDDVVARELENLRRLAPLAIRAFEDGLRADTRYVHHKGTPVALPDRSLAVKTADLVTKRIPELLPGQKTEHSGTVTLEARLAELDARADADTSD